MAVSYSNDLVSDFGRKARDIVLSEQYKSIWSIDCHDESDLPFLSKGSRSVNRFSLDGNREYLGQGLGGGVTGKGGDIIIIDDWIKSHRDLNNRKLDDDWEFYSSTLYNRQEGQEGGASFIIVQTHWHKKDLIGKVIENSKNGGDQWDIVKLQAMATKDEVYNKEDFYYYD